MDRPTQRPSRPYTRDEIAQRVYQHFVLDKSPICRSLWSGKCIYGSTGCAVGCLLTQEDADEFDAQLDGTIEDIISKNKCCVSLYFNTVEDKEFLKELQEAHDNSRPDNLTSRIIKILDSWKCNYAPSQS